MVFRILVATAAALTLVSIGCSHDCEYLSDEEFCALVQQEDWESVRQAYLDYFDEAQNYSECRVDYEETSDEWWFSHEEAPSAIAWLERTDCVDMIYGPDIFPSADPKIEFCAHFVVESAHFPARIYFIIGDPPTTYLIMLEDYSSCDDLTTSDDP